MQNTTEKSSRSAEGLYKFFIYFVLVLLAVTIIVPVAWVFMASIKQNAEFYGNPWALPAGFYWQNFVNAWNGAKMGEYMLNSVIVTALALALLPAAVTMVIIMVNGNVGAGLAVAGTFALVRFRSAQGTAREIVGLFLSMSIGLVCGMGYIYVAMLYFVIMAAFVLLLTLVKFGERNSGSRMLKITIPETLDYDGLFDDLFDKYTSYHELVRVKTTNMGTLYELSYLINLKSDSGTKAFMDDLRCRNGNLNIICGRETDKDSI